MSQSRNNSQENEPSIGPGKYTGDLKSDSFCGSCHAKLYVEFKKAAENNNLTADVEVRGSDEDSRLVCPVRNASFEGIPVEVKGDKVTTTVTLPVFNKEVTKEVTITEKNGTIYTNTSIFGISLNGSLTPEQQTPKTVEVPGAFPKQEQSNKSSENTYFGIKKWW